jgi:putative NADH-flavin reductase
MEKILLFGASGNLGKAIATEAQRQSYAVTIVFRKEAQAQSFISDNFKVVDFNDPASLKGICDGFDIVISALGKSVSPMDRSKP